MVYEIDERGGFSYKNQNHRRPDGPGFILPSGFEVYDMPQRTGIAIYSDGSVCRIDERGDIYSI